MLHNKAHQLVFGINGDQTLIPYLRDKKLYKLS